MAYVPTIWQTGDIVTAEKLNKLENGLANVETGGGVFYFHLIEDFTHGGNEWKFQETWQEIHDALEAGKLVIEASNDEYTMNVEYGNSGIYFPQYVAQAQYNIAPWEGLYIVEVADFSDQNPQNYTCNSADGHPLHGGD